MDPIIKHYFDVLGIEPTTNLQDIKSARNRKNLLLHPDKSNDKNTAPLFRAVQEAFEALMNCDLLHAGIPQATPDSARAAPMEPAQKKQPGPQEHAEARKHPAGKAAPRASEPQMQAHTGCFSKDFWLIVIACGLPLWLFWLSFQLTWFLTRATYGLVCKCLDFGLGLLPGPNQDGYSLFLAVSSLIVLLLLPVIFNTWINSLVFAALYYWLRSLNSMKGFFDRPCENPAWMIAITTQILLTIVSIVTISALEYSLDYTLGFSWPVVVYGSACFLVSHYYASGTSSAEMEKLGSEIFDWAETLHIELSGTLRHVKAVLARTISTTIQSLKSTRTTISGLAGTLYTKAVCWLFKTVDVSIFGHKYREPRLDAYLRLLNVGLYAMLLIAATGMVSLEPMCDAILVMVTVVLTIGAIELLYMAAPHFGEPADGMVLALRIIGRFGTYTILASFVYRVRQDALAREELEADNAILLQAVMEML